MLGRSPVRLVRTEENRLDASGISLNPCKHELIPCDSFTSHHRFHRETYVTKAEFDELKGRFDQLAALVQPLLPSALAGSPYYPMSVPPTSLSGALAEAVHSYMSLGTSTPISMGCGSIMAPPRATSPRQPAYPMETPIQPLRCLTTPSTHRRGHSKPVIGIQKLPHADVHPGRAP